MKVRVKILVAAVVLAGLASFSLALRQPSDHWSLFAAYLIAILLSSGLKVGLPKSEATMSVNFPFILLGIIQLSPLQAICLAAASVLAQCRIRVMKPFTIVQIIFNVMNVMTATFLAGKAYGWLASTHIEFAPALAIAATTYFVANTVCVALVIAWDGETNPFVQWRSDFLWYLPFYLVGAMLAATASLIGSHFGWMTSLLLVPLVYTIYRAYTAQRAIVRDREQHALDTEALHLRTIEGLAMAIEAKDQSTHLHLQRVRVYVSGIGKMLGLDQSMMQALLTAAYLHDIGKLAVPEHIINKPGKLTLEEFEKMKIHPIVGADILERVRFPYPVVPIVRAHHEAWDGSGYPDGLKGMDIPIGARILTAVDCFDALASERPYRRALPLADAMAIVKNGAGRQFDPEVVALLEANYIALEEEARHEIAIMAPLKTDMLVERGEAPGAGFQVDHVSEKDAATGEGEDAPARRQNDSLNLIAAASQEAKAIFELSQMLGSSLSARETSLMMSQRLQPLIPFDCFAVYLKSDTVLVTQFLDGVNARAFNSDTITIGEGLSGWVAHSERPILNGNPTVESNVIPGSDVYTETSSALSIPLFDLRGVVFGALTIYSVKSGAFSNEHIRILQAIESKFSLSLLNALRFKTAEADATIDHITQLPNVRTFFKMVDAEVARARAEERQFGMVVCDLNSFKAVNDRYGHLTGNNLLRMIADAFQDCCHPGDVVARMGGDEFVFFFPCLTKQSAEQHTSMIELAVLSAAANLKIETGVSSSVGVAFFPEDGNSAEQLLGVADRKMYLQKHNANLPVRDHYRDLAVSA